MPHSSMRSSSVDTPHSALSLIHVCACVLGGGDHMILDEIFYTSTPHNCFLFLTKSTIFPVLVCRFFQLFLFSGESHSPVFNFPQKIKQVEMFHWISLFSRKTIIFSNSGKSLNSWKKEVELIQSQTMGIGIAFKELLFTVTLQCIYDHYFFILLQIYAYI